MSDLCKLPHMSNIRRIAALVLEVPAPQIYGARPLSPPELITNLAIPSSQYLSLFRTFLSLTR